MRRHSAGDASRLAALLLPRIWPIFSVVAPCQPGASPPSVLRRIYEMSSSDRAVHGKDKPVTLDPHGVTRYKRGMTRRPTRRVLVTTLVGCCSLLACSRVPTGPGEGPLATGRWTGDGACLSVTETGCHLAVGCGHGQFSRPIIRADGTFEVDGTYRIEVGPISIEPAPPAHFSGSIAGSRLTLTVVPTTGSPRPASYSMTPASDGGCPIPCV